MSIAPCCLATAIGSLPHNDPEKACKSYLKAFPKRRSGRNCLRSA